MATQIVQPENPVTNAAVKNIHSLSTIALGAGATNAVVLAQLYSLLTYVQQLSYQLQQKQVETQATIAIANGNAARSAMRDQASATRSNAIGGVVGGSLGVTAGAAGVYKTNFGAEAQTIKQESKVVNTADEKIKVLDANLPKAEPVIAGQANAAGQGAGVDREAVMANFMRKEPLPPTQVPSAASQLHDGEHTQIRDTMAANKKTANEKIHDANNQITSFNQQAHNFGQALNGLATGIGGLAAAGFQVDQADEEQQKAVLDAAGQMVVSSLQTLQAIAQTMAQMQQSAIQNLDAAQAQQKV